VVPNRTLPPGAAPDHILNPKTIRSSLVSEKEGGVANKQNPPSDERSDVEFLYFKGKLRSADIQALVSGFTSTRSSVLPNRNPSKQISPAGAQNGAPEVDQEVDLELIEEPDVEPNGVATPRAPSIPRKTRNPKPIDIDINGDGCSFESFIEPLTAEQLAGPQMKFLVAAAWMHEHGNPKLDAVSIGHVYACYLHADWAWDAPANDHTDPFRKLRKDGLGNPAKAKDGKFEINGIGLKRVEKMRDATRS
jgi:hypothetical protein